MSFNAFLRAGGSFTPHCEWVHELDITLPSAFPHPCQISRLSDTIVALTGLRTLTIRNPEVIFNQVPSFRRVFEGLKTLSDLTIVGAGPESIKLLQNSRSYLQSVRILEPVWRFPMATALGGSSASTACEELVAYNCHVPPLSDNATVIPTLRRLHIPKFCIEADHRAGFMSIAPNLQVLDVGTEYSKLPWSHELARHRHINKTATIDFQLQVSSSQRPNAWTELELVRGGLIDLLVFANTCPVAALELVGEPIAGTTLQWLIPEVILDYQPRIVRFSLAGPELDMRAFVPERERLDTVEGVYVRIVLTSVPTAAEWAECKVSHCFFLGLLRMRASKLSPPPMFTFSSTHSLSSHTALRNAECSAWSSRRSAQPSATFWRGRTARRLRARLSLARSASLSSAFPPL